ncbi:uncharacterized protein LOC111032512 [Myzus persicae]|uniref:uncharacterized protein LOC111032512 n=1 Tax=Myzus persicae TaxID=13164 RepID=UPI000B932387|nr:uncharacterized protein LOC111032512 [Myzus persicae]
MLMLLRIAELIIPIMISICMMGFKNKNVTDYVKMLQLQSHESHWFFKIVFTQIAIYVSLFFTMLVICGLLIKEQIPKKLVLIGSVVQVLLCIASSYFLLQFHKDMGKFELVLCSSAFGFNGLLFTIDAIIMFQQIVFSRPR